MSQKQTISRRDILSLITATGALTCIPWQKTSLLFSKENNKTWPSHVQDFPVLTTDGEGTIWLAVLERPMPTRYIGVYHIENGRKNQVAILYMNNLTGIAAPAIAPLYKGCFVVFPYELDDQWHLAYAFIDPDQKNNASCQIIQCPGHANISPSVAVHKDRGTIVWESNDGQARGIYTISVTRTNQGQIQRLSSEHGNSYNPSIVALPNGDHFAAWDSYRETNCDIWGAWFKDNQWQSEKRITSDPRIERHPFLAVRDDDVWMTWQAQSYAYGKRDHQQNKAPIALNYVREQRIVVAQLKRNTLMAPKGLFEKVSTEKEPHLKTPDQSNLLLCPRLAFDDKGTLYLTARQSIHQNAGWLPLLWQYEGDRWSDPYILMDEQGRWRPVPITFNKTMFSTSVQFDDLPKTWDDTRGKYRDWRSGFFIQSKICKENHKIELLTEELKMPSTDFSLQEKMVLCSANFPRQKTTYKNKNLFLFFGDFHDHTDLSVCQRATNPPGHDLFANERDIEQLDFCATTDHGYNFDHQQWQFNGEQTRNNHDPGRFVTLLGEEWTSGNSLTSGGFGHHNFIFLDPYHEKFYDAFDGIISPQDIWDTFEKENIECITIPHQLADWRHKGKGNPPKEWVFNHEKYMPVAEIWQHRQSYEYLGCPRQATEGMSIKGHYLQDAWDKGIIIGVIASPDHGGGHGKVGVWAENLTRQDIFRAVQTRHTFGTSGPKMGLLFKSGDAIMGDKVKKRTGTIPFEIKATAMRDIQELVIFRNNQIVHRIEPGHRDVHIDWIDSQPLDVDHAWYYVRIQTTDHQLAWSSPIWFIA